VLVVEDDPLMRKHALQILETLGYRVLAAGNAQEALVILRQPQPLDLLFSDIVMPGGVDGPHLAEVARQLRPALRVLLSTGYADMLVNDTQGGGTALPVIPKPYRRLELARKLRDVLDSAE
jgi:CheY-like chemotaxis protein